MQELRLVGVQEDGRHLELAAADGKRYKVVLSEELRVAVRSRRRAEGSATTPASARDVQALVRSGLSIQEVAERADWPLAKVEVFAAPVLAERAHVAARAGAARLRPEDTDNARLAARVAHRLAGRGVDPREIQWDAGRDDSGHWRVHVDFVAGGRERRAVWRFDPATEHLAAQDDEARWLSEDDDIATRVQPHRFGGEQVFDVEKSGDLSGGDDALIALVPAPTGRNQDSDALMTVLREHSHAGQRGGRRRRRAQAPATTGGPAAGGGQSMDSDPAQGSGPAGGTQQAGGHQGGGLPVDSSQEGGSQEGGSQAGGDPVRGAPDPEAVEARLPESPLPATPLHGAAELPFAEFQNPESVEIDFPDSDAIPPPARGTHPKDREPASGLSTAQPSPPEPKAPSKRPGRVGVPSWNDVMFGPSRGERG